MPRSQLVHEEYRDRDILGCDRRTMGPFGERVSFRRLLERLRSWLASPRAPLGIVALSTLLVAPSLAAGLAVDDHWHKIGLTRDARWGPILEPWHALFTFYDGNPARTQWLVDAGLSPWWTNPHLVAAFFRPVSAATHALDYALWPSHPWLMHAQSIAWYAALVAVAAWLYRRLLAPLRGESSSSGWVAGLAALLYGLDHTHAMPAGWIANRNAIVAAFFALASLGAHDVAVRGRAGGNGDTPRRRVPWTIASALLFALALGSGESALGVAGFFAAHAVFLDERSWRARVASLSPHAIIAAAWAALYRAGGFGVRGSGMYVEPLRAPAEFAATLGKHLPLLVASELGMPPPDAYPFFPPAAQLALVAVALLFLAWSARAVVLLWRADPRARFLVAGGVLAALPACAVFPAGRLLAVAGFGFIGFVALVGAGIADGASWVPRSRAWPVRSFAIWSCGGHLLLSPFAMQVGLWQMAILNQTIARFSAGLPASPEAERRRVVLINSPDTLLASYVIITRRLDGEQVPARMLTLAGGARTVVVTRTDERTVVVRVEGGFYRSGTEVVTRSDSAPIPVGSQLRVGDVAVEVLRTTDGGIPTEAAFRFEPSVAADSYLWMRWEGSKIVSVRPPAIGEHMTIPGQLLRPW